MAAPFLVTLVRAAVQSEHFAVQAAAGLAPYQFVVALDVKALAAAAFGKLKA